MERGVRIDVPLGEPSLEAGVFVFTQILYNRL
jgi:hypothetical protein